MGRWCAVFIAAGALSGCGLAETGTAAGAGAASQAQQAASAKRSEERVKQQIDDAYSHAAEQRAAADADAK